MDDAFLIQRIDYAIDRLEGMIDNMTGSFDRLTAAVERLAPASEAAKPFTPEDLSEIKEALEDKSPPRTCGECCQRPENAPTKGFWPCAVHCHEVWDSHIHCGENFKPREVTP